MTSRDEKENETERERDSRYLDMIYNRKERNEPTLNRERQDVERL